MTSFALEIEDSDGSEDVEECSYCHSNFDREDGMVDHRGTFYCQDCADEYLFRCFDCEEFKDHKQSTAIANGEPVCDSCRDNNYFYCDSCDEYYGNGQQCSVDDGNSYVCQDCADSDYVWCDECDTYHSEDQGVCDQDCDCEAPHQTFTFPIAGDGHVPNDERYTVELPAGVIDVQGIGKIVSAIERHGGPSDVLDENFDTAWQLRTGNFPKRLTKAMYHYNKFKAKPELIAEIGNLAKLHSSDHKSHNIEFTRRLNASPDEFCNEESCWWTGEHRSKCALKACGGMAIRFYADGSNYAYGRAWVIPLDERLQPTFVTRAHAYVVFNVYGMDSGFEVARVVAHLTGKSYRQIEFTANMWINNKKGFLVAEQGTCDNIERVSTVIETGNYC